MIMISAWSEWIHLETLLALLESTFFEVQGGMCTFILPAVCLGIWTSSLENQDSDIRKLFIFS